jgi:hypothetical protein
MNLKKLSILFTLRERRWYPDESGLRCQGFGVDDYSQTLDALQLRHPQLSLN